jgi:chromopyrrolic acid synthase
MHGLTGGSWKRSLRLPRQLPTLLIVQHFAEAPDHSLRRSVLMNSAIEVMNDVMRPLAELLVTLPSGVRGHTAGPSFELDFKPDQIPCPDVARRAFVLRLEAISAACAKCSVVSDRTAKSASFLANLFRRGATS